MTSEKVIITITTPTGEKRSIGSLELSDEVALHIDALEATSKVKEATPERDASSSASDVKNASSLPDLLVTQTQKPWEDTSKTPRGLNFQPDAALHAKMEWVCNNVPKMSKLRILREGAELLCDQLIAKHYKA